MPYSKSIILLSLLLLIACQKDDDLPVNCSGSGEPEPEPCMHNIEDFSVAIEDIDSTFDFTDCPIGFWDVYPGKYRYQDPVFNPNNANEFAFIRIDNELFGLCNRTLCVFNFCSGEFKILTNNACSEPDWSTTDWIAFLGEGQQLYKIKANDDSLTVLTHKGININPSWSVTGDNIAFHERHSGKGYFIIANSMGDHLDTIPELETTDHQKLSHNNLIAYARGSGNDYGLAFIDIVTQEWQQIEFLELSSLLFDTDWSNNNESILWTAPQHIAKTNIFSRERTTIATGATNRVFQSLALSPDGEKIIIQQLDRRKASACEREVRSNLYIMDADGMNKRKILIPE